MYNFFNPISTQEANIYYLSWLLSQTEAKNNKCFKKAKSFLEKCYEVGNHPFPNNIDSIQVLYTNSRELHCMVNDTLIVIKVFMIDSLFRMLSYKQMDTRFIHDNEIEEDKQKYNANDHILIFLETEYIGNIIQIEDETHYGVIHLYEYVNLLAGSKCENVDQIDNEFIRYEKTIADTYLKYETLEYEQWKIPQYKGFYKYLQLHFNDGEGKHNREFGNLQYFDIFETEISGATVYFRLLHNTNQLSVRACFDSVQKKKSDRKIVQSQIKMLADTLKLELKLEPRPGRSICTTLGVFVDPVIKLDKHGIIDKSNTIKQIKKFKTLLDNASSI